MAAVWLLCTETIWAGSSQPEALLSLSLEQLMDIQVQTASRTDEAYFHTPGAVSVITAEMIRASRADNLPDLLARLPGVHVAQLSRSRHVVSVRGDSQLYLSTVLLLIDGQPSYSPYLEGELWEAFPVPLSDIERIELVRGSGGSAWGLNSTSGVLNIITRHPKSKAQATAHAAVGNDGDGHASVSWDSGGKAGGVQLVAEHGSLLGKQTGEVLRKQRVGVDGEWFNDDWSHRLQWRGFNEQGREYSFAGMSQPPGPLSDTSIQTMYLTGSSTLERGDYRLRMQLDYDTVSADLGVLRQRGSDFQGTSAELAWEQSRRLGLDKYLLVAGCQDIALDAPATGNFRYDPADGHLRQCSLSATAFARIADELMLQPGVRYEHHNLINATHHIVAPSLHLGWNPGETQFYWFSLQRSEQVPNYIQLASVNVVGVAKGMPVLFRSDPELKPKTVDETQLGGRWQWSNQHLLEATAFYTRFRRQINVDQIYPQVANGQILQYYRNLMHGRTAGIELEWQSWWTPSLQTRLAYSHFDKHNQPPETPVYPEPNDQYSYDGKWNAGLTWAFYERWLLDVAVLHYSAYMSEGQGIFTPGARIPAHWRLDLALNWQITPKTAVFVSGKNLFADEPEWIYPFGVTPVQSIRPTGSVGLEIQL